MAFPKMVTTLSPTPMFFPLRCGVCVVFPPLETYQAIMLCNRDQFKMTLRLGCKGFHFAQWN